MPRAMSAKHTAITSFLLSYRYKVLINARGGRAHNFTYLSIVKERYAQRALILKVSTALLAGWSIM